MQVFNETAGLLRLILLLIPGCPSANKSVHIFYIFRTEKLKLQNVLFLWKNGFYFLSEDIRLFPLCICTWSDYFIEKCISKNI